jgi:hypothetical protein
MPAQPRHYALVVGINDYPNYGSQGRPLKGAVADARRFENWLRDKDEGGGLSEENCKVIVSSKTPVAPLQDQIDAALEQIWVSARRSGGDRLYFYFSGHGQSAEADNIALCLANWSSARRHAALSSRHYLQFIKECTPFREVVVLLDCCRVRQIGVVGRNSELGCPVATEGAGRTRTFIGYATEFQQLAFEAAGTSSEAEHAGPVEEIRGHFTEALISALRGGAARPEGGVTASALKAHLELEVPRLAQAKQQKQFSQVVSDMPSTDEPVFGAAKPLANCEIRFSPGRAGQIRLEGPDLHVIQEADAATAPWRLTLRPGRYCLIEIATGQELIFPFRPTEAAQNVTF